MDYKKEYEAALARAKDLHDNHPYGEPPVWTTCEKIFPELKESEDERIRKEIISYIKSSGAVTNPNWIAWLEKQGEHANFRNKIQIGDKVTRNEDGVLVNLSQFKRMVKQGEQKTAWSEEDKKNYQTLQKIICDSDITANLANKLSDWLKSLKPQNRWKPSKEQLEALKYFISFHKPQANAAVEGWKEFKNLESLYNDLKSL